MSVHVKLFRHVYSTTYISGLTALLEYTTHPLGKPEGTRLNQRAAINPLVIKDIRFISLKISTAPLHIIRIMMGYHKV